MNHHEGLRQWARGLYALEAATELLIRGFGGKFAKPGNPWVHTPQGDEYPWIDFEQLPEHIGALSGGERRYLLLATSLAGYEEVKLGDLLPGLDRPHLKLVMAAVSHAAGSHQSGRIISFHGDGVSVGPLEDFGPLYPWPPLPAQAGVNE